jgi:PAS domain S-box-containing protein
MLSLVSAEGRVVWASEQGSRMIYGRDPQDVIGQPVDALVHESELAKVHGALSHALIGDTVSCDIWAANAEGEWRRVRLLLWPTREHDHVIVITMANVLDPTAMGPP